MLQVDIRFSKLWDDGADVDNKGVDWETDEDKDGYIC